MSDKAKGLLIEVDDKEFNDVFENDHKVRDLNDDELENESYDGHDQFEKNFVTNENNYDHIDEDILNVDNENDHIIINTNHQINIENATNDYNSLDALKKLGMVGYFDNRTVGEIIKKETTTDNLDDFNNEQNIIDKPNDIDEIYGNDLNIENNPETGLIDKDHVNFIHNDFKSIVSDFPSLRGNDFFQKLYIPIFYNEFRDPTSEIMSYL